MIYSVKKALDILSALSDNNSNPITVTQLAKLVGINRSTCTHLVATLVECGYAERVSYKEGYILGPESYCLSRFGKYEESIISICSPILKWLYKKTGKAVILATIKKDQKFIIESLDNENTVFERKQTIRRDDIYRTATGRIILANMYDDEKISIYKKYGKPEESVWDEVTSEKSFLTELHKIDKKSIIKTSHYSSKYDAYSIGYGAAIFKGVKCIGAIGIAVTVRSGDTYDSKDEEEIKANMKKAVAEINRRFNYE